jgi:hypothetical protein
MSEVQFPADIPRGYVKNLLSGMSVTITLPAPFGTAGDEVVISDTRFRIIDVLSMPLYYVLTDFYRLEGFLTAGGFSASWERDHRGYWIGTENVSVHFFAMIPEI